MASLHECCCCVSPPPASVSPSEVTENGVKAPARSPPVHHVMEWDYQRSSSSRVRKLSSSSSSVQRVHKKFSVLDSFDKDDSVFVTDQPSKVLVLYCGGTIGMRSQQGGMVVVDNDLFLVLLAGMVVVYEDRMKVLGFGLVRGLEILRTRTCKTFSVSINC